MNSIHGNSENNKSYSSLGVLGFIGLWISYLFLSIPFELAEFLFFIGFLVSFSFLIAYVISFAYIPELNRLKNSLVSFFVCLIILILFSFGTTNFDIDSGIKNVSLGVVSLFLLIFLGITVYYSLSIYYPSVMEYLSDSLENQRSNQNSNRFYSRNNQNSSRVSTNSAQNYVPTQSNSRDSYGSSIIDKFKGKSKEIYNQELSKLRSFENEFMVSQHPRKKVFNAIGKLNKVHRGNIPLSEIHHQTKLSINVVQEIVREFINLRLINGYLRKTSELNGSEDLLVLQQDTYFCIIDKSFHNIFELHFQCEKCLRFVCAECYQNSPQKVCTFCKGNLIPVPRGIFETKDEQTGNIAPTKLKGSISGYIESRRQDLAKKGVKRFSKVFISDIKTAKDQLSIDKIKETTTDYFDYRKKEQSISENEQKVIDAITTVYDVENISEIQIIRISKLTGINDINLTYEILKRLIAKQTINGYIETNETFETIGDDLLVLNSDTYLCEITEKEFPINNPHFQCSTCFRSISEKAFREMSEQGVSNCLFCGEEMIYVSGLQK